MALSYRSALLPLLWLGALATLSSCSGCDETAAGAPCETVYEGECGKPCQLDNDCVAGVYCGADGKCTADCTPDGGQCDAGVACTGKGRCASGGDGGAGGGTTGSFANAGGGTDSTVTGCANVTVTFEPQTPTVVLLVDQSGSMTAAFPGPGGTRWSVLYSVLMDPTTGVVGPLQDVVRFGLALYTGADGNPTCPLLTQVNVTLGNFMAIDSAYAAAVPIEDTPTGDSISAILPALLAFSEPGPKAIVLATDGEPDTCAVLDPQNGQPEAIAAAQAAQAAGVNLYIIAVGADVSLQHQQDMANAGAGLAIGGSMGNAPYYPAGDQTALAQAFQTIINGERSCVLTVSGTVDPTKADQGVVYLDGVPIPINDPNGWQLTSPSEIELLGTSCTTIQDGTHTVEGEFPCDAIIPM